MSTVTEAAALAAPAQSSVSADSTVARSGIALAVVEEAVQSLGSPGSPPPSPSPPVWSSRLGLPCGSATLPDTALPVSQSATASVEALGSSERWTAAAPATCGAAIEVPEMVWETESEPIQAEVMATPGAKRSTQDP